MRSRAISGIRLGRGARSDRGARSSRGAALAGTTMLLVLFAVLVCGAGSAGAVLPAAGWALDAAAVPSSFTEAADTECLRGLSNTFHDPKFCDAYRVTARNAGAGSSDGSTITLATSLPPGLTVQRIKFYWSGLPAEDGGPGLDLGELFCTTAPVRCELPTGELRLPPVAPDGALEMIVFVTVG